MTMISYAQKRWQEANEAEKADYGELITAAVVASSLSMNLAQALACRNSDPDQARELLTLAFKNWPCLCRVMARLEAAAPQQAFDGALLDVPIKAIVEARENREIF